MGLFERFPYTNFHELNSTWIIEELVKLKTTIEQFVSINALKYADPIQWNIVSQYEKNTIVIDPLTGTAYISVQPVPSGVIITNTDYWTVVFDLGSFVVRAAKNFTDKFEEETTLTATFPTNVNDWLIWGDVLYIVLSPIVAGDQYVIGSNIQHFTAEDVIGHIQDLNTNDKSNLVAAINELVQALIDEADRVDDITGDLDNLTTSDKSNLVAAINEIFTDVTNLINNTIGDISDLATLDNTTIVDAINELVGRADWVTPQMYGAKADGVTDDSTAFTDAIATGKLVVVPIGSYYLASTVVMPHQSEIIGLDRFKTILKFPSGVNGVQINHSTVLSNLTISFADDAAGIYLYTPDDYAYNLKSKCSDLILEHRSDTIDGAAIKLVAEKVGATPEGAYDGLFDTLYITNNVKYGIYMHGKAHTTSLSDCWLTDMLFRNIFIDRAEVAIMSDWEDASGNNSVPLTGPGPLFSALFENVRAQYYSGVSKHFVHAYNLNRGTFINCKSIDYFHAVIDDNNYVFIFNGYSGMSRIYMDSSSITHTYKWIGFENITPNDPPSYNAALFECFIFLGTIQEYYPNQGGKMPKTYGNFINELIHLKGTDAFTINTSNYATIDNTHGELVVGGNTVYFEASLGFTAQPLTTQRLGTLATAGIEFSEIYFYGAYGLGNSDGVPILMKLQQDGGLFIVDNTQFPATPAGRLRFSFAAPLLFRAYN